MAYLCRNCGERFSYWDADVRSGPHENGIGWQAWIVCPYCAADTVDEVGDDESEAV